MITADYEPRAGVNPEGAAQEGRDEQAAKAQVAKASRPRRVISPDAFDSLTGRPRRSAKLKRAGFASGLLAGLFVAGLLVLRPMLRSSEATVPVNVSGSSYDVPPRPRVPGPQAPADPIGRLVAISELPENAWLEIDGRVYASGLGIDVPLRVVADTAHRVAIHARGYRSWTSEVYVPVDSLVRLEVSLERLRTVPESRPATRRSETQQPAAQPAVTDTPPPLPIALRDSLLVRLEQGRVFHEISRYFDATAEYQWVLDRLAGASGQYGGSSVLQMLRARADSGLQAVRRDCRAEGLPRCPQ